METINKSLDNMGGVISLWAIPQADYFLTGNTLTVVSDQNMIKISIQEDSASFNENPIAGPAFQTEISGTIPCDSADTLKLIRQMERVLKYNVIFQDGNGNFKLAGTKEVPLRFTAKLTTGPTSQSLNSYSFSFLAKAISTRAVFINDPFAFT